MKCRARTASLTFRLIVFSLISGACRHCRILGVGPSGQCPTAAANHSATHGALGDRQSFFGESGSWYERTQETSDNLKMTGYSTTCSSKKRCNGASEWCIICWSFRLNSPCENHTRACEPCRVEGSSRQQLLSLLCKGRGSVQLEGCHVSIDCSVVLWFVVV